MKLRLFFDEKIGSGAKASVIEKLGPESHKPLIKKFKRKKVCAKFKDNICAVYLAEMLPLSFGNYGDNCLFCVVNAFRIYARLKPWREKKLKQS